MTAVAVLLGFPLLVLTSGAGQAGPTHGLVGSFCDSSRVAADKAAGVGAVVFGARWDLMIPTRGTPDPNYQTALANALRTCANAGLRVIVDTGMNYPPAWAQHISGGQLLDQYGDEPSPGALDLVFNGDVRTAVSEYLRTLVAAFPPYTVDAVRVGTASSGELGLPGSLDGGKGHNDSWWAFNTAAQNGSTLASGQSANPMPRWVPGQSTWNGRAVTSSDALTWFRWYDRSVAQAEYFLSTAVLSAGFNGAIHLPTAGRGVLPATLSSAVSSLLAGANLVDDSFSRGLDYVDQVPLLASAMPAVVIDLTSVDDATAVRARAVSPPQDLCALSDGSAVADPATPVAKWSNLRFTRALVARAGLSAVGENPGPPSAVTGGVADSDSESQQLSRSPGYARSCGLAALFFAFEDDLYTGRSGISATAYTNAW